MKSFANLYVAELQPKREQLSLNRVAASLGSLLLVIVLVGFGLNFYAGQQKIQTQRLQHEYSQVQQQLTAKQSELRNAMNNPELEQKIASIEDKLGERQRLLQQMKLVTETSEVSFAQLLEDVARADVEAIWLQRIVVANNQLTLQGKTANASALPQWLASFSQHASLSDRQFGVFELRDQEGSGALDFTVGSLQHSSILTSPLATRRDGQ